MIKQSSHPRAYGASKIIYKRDKEEMRTRDSAIKNKCKILMRIQTAGCKSRAEILILQTNSDASVFNLYSTFLYAYIM